MAAIIKMNSKEFLDDFLDKFNYKKYNFILVSNDITTQKKYDNVYAIPSLIPPPNVMAELIREGDVDKYAKKYIKYLSQPKVEAFITVLVKLAVVENSNVIILCSKDEYEYDYIELLSDYISTVYGAKVFSYKKYKKNPKKCDSSDGNKKKIVKVLRKKIANIDIESEDAVNKSDIKERLKKLSRKELIKFAKSKGLSIKKSKEKSEIIKKILDTLF